MSTATAPLLPPVSKKKTISSILTFLFMIGFVAPAFSQANHIKKIRERYQDVNKRIAECERNGEDAETFLIETIVNKNNGSYPAVGLYQATVKFYYTYGDREKNPYPDRLLKILVSVNRAARTESSEFLFDEAENLIFYYEKKEEEEQRLYFNRQKPISLINGEQSVPLNGRKTGDFLRQVTNKKEKLIKIFKNSLDF